MKLDGRSCSILFFSALISAHSLTISTPLKNDKAHRMKIRIGVIPAAGLGTRFLPFTKSVPKELLPIMNKPAIQYIIEEGKSAGIESFCIVSNEQKKALEHYLKHDGVLEKSLAEKSKLSALDELNAIIDNTKFSFVMQDNPRGLGHAIGITKEVVGNNFFAVFLPDDIMACNTPAIAQLISAAEKYEASVIAVQEVPREKSSSYGMVAIAQELEDGIFDIEHLVEKPQPADAPSNLAITGRYVLSPRIFEMIEKTRPGSGGEIQLTDAIDALIKSGERVIACKLEGNRFDVGVPQGWLKAIEYYSKSE